MLLRLLCILGVSILLVDAGGDDISCFDNEVHDKERNLCFFTYPDQYETCEQPKSVLCANRFGGEGVRATAHSDNQTRLMQGLARKYYSTGKDDEELIWLGAHFNGTEWMWEDGSAWDYDNWAEGEQFKATDTQVIMRIKDGKFLAYNPEYNMVVMCQGPTLDKFFTDSPACQCTTEKPSVQPVCPSGWTIFSDTASCYTVLFSATWMSAEEQCGELGGHLASIHSSGENAFVAKLTRTYLNATEPFQMTWTGLNYQTGLDFVPAWSWSDSSPVDFINWAPKEPTNPSTKKCAMVSQDGSKQAWYTTECDSQMRAFVCKKAATH